MTKHPPRASKRTDPLDRDGDGRPGGSLPGNETAPYAEGAAPPTEGDELADVRTTPGDSPEKLEAIERETDEANAAGGADTPPTDTPPAEDQGDGDDADQPPLFDTPDEDGPAGTFTAEEIAAGQTPVIEAEGEQVATAADTAPTEDLTSVQLDTAPGDQPRTVAVRTEQLRLLAQNRWLYRSEHGYGAPSGPPYVDQSTIDVWIEAGLCEFSPTAGNDGGVRITHEGRRVLGVAQRAA